MKRLEFLGVVIMSKNHEKQMCKECFQKGLEHQTHCCNTSSNSHQNSQPNSIAEPSPTYYFDTAVLFVKADRGKTMLEEIKSKHFLQVAFNDNLVSYTNRIWIGSSSEYDKLRLNSIFSKPGTISEMCPEYDIIAIKVKFSPISVQSQDIDSFTLRELIRDLCVKNTSCEKISNRLDINDIQEFPLKTLG